ncbi:site-specific integrase [Sphingomonas japonica]|uniref:Integrase n=1 Tax=Sphingomonas japonica TaxID=511662 RepID=A0ABX0TX50_9SPHN|nr:site-specific integrase [Sphingomonas japonica]NIJ22865.1 integrase [Sphingomonas japonica]
MNAAPHLHKRNNSQHWQLRLMVPKAARPILGRHEFTKSLGVADRRRAVDLSHAHLADWKAQIAVALASASVGPLQETSVPDAFELEEIALEVGFERASVRAADLVARKAKLGPAAFAMLSPEFERRYREAVRRRRAGDHSYWIERARKLVIERGWTLAETDPAFATLVDYLAAAGSDTLAFAKALADGSESNFAPSQFVQSARKRRESRARQGQSISELFERYASQRLSEGRQRQDTVDQGRKVISLFTGFVGAHRSLASITQAEVREWRNLITTLPPAFRKRKENAGLTLQEASEKAQRTGASPMAANTVNRYLSTLSPLFDWARQEGYVERNPCDGLFYDLQKGKKSGKNRRPPFTTEQLNTILASPLFTGFLRDGKEWEPGTCRADDWRYWIPLVCLFTGARIGEIAQLRADDVREQDGVTYLWIKDDEATGQRTKSGHCRPAPIHSMLRKLGWLSYVARQRARAEKDGDGRLFPELEPNMRGQISWTPSRFWRTYLIRLGIKSGRDGYGSHSFRHGLADQLRTAGYLDDEIEVALGHNQVSVTAGYGQVRQGTVARLSSMIEAVVFAGVSFEHLVPAPT